VYTGVDGNFGVERRILTEGRGDNKRGSVGVKRQSHLAGVWEGAHVNKRRHCRFQCYEVEIDNHNNKETYEVSQFRMWER